MVDPTSRESKLLFQQARDADSDAATDLHDRYSRRLLALIRTRISQPLQSRFDPEDVVNSAFRSFFCSLADGRFTLPSHGGLWPLLAQIAIHKLHRATKHHQRLRRNVSAEAASDLTANVHVADHKLAEVALCDELDWLAEKLPTQSTTAIELSIQGFSHDEIASRLNCSSRSVRRYIAEARVLLRFRLGLVTDSAGDDESPKADVDLPLENYLLRRLIGAGTFGKVYLATDRTTGADVAVKYLRRRWTRNSKVVSQFVAETRTLSRLSIQGIVPCLGGGSTGDGGRFIVIKWIEGETLADRISRQPLTLNQAKAKFADLAMTLHELHRQGITHCDLKPSNILIDKDQQWCITDFGFALHDSEPREAFAGTPHYMAPEQLNPLRGPIGPWTDLFAVGVMISESLGVELGQATQQPLQSFTTQLQSLVPESLLKTIIYLLQPQVDQRCPAALELHRRLS